MADLEICKLSHWSATVTGGMKMILLCEKVAKEDIQIRFFEEKNGKLFWEGYGNFEPTDVHKQTAIEFRTPCYHTQQVDEPVQMYIQLTRPSDGYASEPLPFSMLPSRAPISLRRHGMPIVTQMDSDLYTNMITSTFSRAERKFSRNSNKFNNDADTKRPNFIISVIRFFACCK